jgi:hypothetical protein
MDEAIDNSGRESRSPARVNGSSTSGPGHRTRGPAASPRECATVTGSRHGRRADRGPRRSVAAKEGRGRSTSASPDAEQLPFDDASFDRRRSLAFRDHVRRPSEDAASGDAHGSAGAASCSPPGSPIPAWPGRSPCTAGISRPRRPPRPSTGALPTKCAASSGPASISASKPNDLASASVERRRVGALRPGLWSDPDPGRIAVRGTTRGVSPGLPALLRGVSDGRGNRGAEGVPGGDRRQAPAALRASITATEPS